MTGAHLSSSFFVVSKVTAEVRQTDRQTDTKLDPDDLRLFISMKNKLKFDNLSV